MISTLNRGMARLSLRHVRSHAIPTIGMRDAWLWLAKSGSPLSSSDVLVTIVAACPGHIGSPQ